MAEAAQEKTSIAGPRILVPGVNPGNPILRCVRIQGITPLLTLALRLGTLGLLFGLGAAAASAQTDCLACHGDLTMTDGSGHKIGVDGNKFHSSIHGSLQCGDCHADIKEYPHPDHPAKVQCSTCHTDQATALQGSVHGDSKEHPCTSCHGDAHSIFPKTDRAPPFIR